MCQHNQPCQRKQTCIPRARPKRRELHAHASIACSIAATALTKTWRRNKATRAVEGIEEAKLNDAPPPRRPLERCPSCSWPWCPSAPTSSRARCLLYNCSSRCRRASTVYCTRCSRCPNATIAPVLGGLLYDAPRLRKHALTLSRPYVYWVVRCAPGACPQKPDKQRSRRSTRAASCWASARRRRRVVSRGRVLASATTRPSRRASGGSS